MFASCPIQYSCFLTSFPLIDRPSFVIIKHPPGKVHRELCQHWRVLVPRNYRPIRTPSLDLKRRIPPSGKPESTNPDQDVPLPDDDDSQWNLVFKEEKEEPMFPIPPGFVYIPGASCYVPEQYTFDGVR